MCLIERGISIIVPTHGRVAMVERMLKTLKEARTAYAGDTEVILVDSSGREDSLKIQSLCETFDAKIHFNDNHVCKKRNFGITKSHYNIIFFIDSDCEADKDVLVKHYEFRETLKEHSAILGYTDWAGPKTEIWKILDLITGFGSAFNFAKWFDEVPWGTCTNLMVEKSWLLSIGGFDESIPIKVFGDDVDLGLRLSKAGCKIRCNPAAVVSHSRLPYQSFSKVMYKYYLSGRADFHLGMRHPERLHLDFPGPLFIFFLLLILSIGRVIAGEKPWLLMIPLLWGFIFLIFSSLLMNFINKRGVSSYLFQILSFLPNFSFEAGRIFESMMNLKPFAIGQKFIYVKDQLIAEHTWKNIKLYLFLLTIPPALVLILLL